MATPVANLNALLQPLPAAGTPPLNSSAATTNQPLGLFQTALAVAAGRALPADTALVTRLAFQELEAGGVGLEDAITDEVRDAALAAGAVVPGVAQLLVPPLATQDVAVPRQGVALDGVVAEVVTGQVPAQSTLPAAEAEVLSRAEQLRLEQPAVPARPDATVPQPTTARTGPVAGPVPQPVDPALPLTVPAAPSRVPVTGPADTTGVPVRGPLIPAQAPVVAGLLPNLQATSQLAPPPEQPTPIVTVGASGLPGVQVGDRPLMAGERFAAIATAGARLVNPAAAPVAFGQVLGQEVGPTAEPADRTPDVVPPAGATGPLPPYGVAKAATAAPAVQVADEIVTHARVLERDGAVEFRLQLDPPELGRVRVNLLANGDEIRGQVIVADDAVRRMIETNLSDLRQRLEAAGLNVQRFDITADPGTGGGRNPYRDDTPAGLFPNNPLPPAGPPRPAVYPRPTAGSVDITV